AAGVGGGAGAWSHGPAAVRVLGDCHAAHPGVGCGSDLAAHGAGSDRLRLRAGIGRAGRHPRVPMADAPPLSPAGRLLAGLHANETGIVREGKQTPAGAVHRRRAGKAGKFSGTSRVRVKLFAVTVDRRQLMSSSLNVLDLIEVAVPCNVSWD